LGVGSAAIGVPHGSAVVESVQSARLTASGVYKRGSRSSAVVPQRLRRYRRNTDPTNTCRAVAPEPGGLR
jgi:hypothetical protein